MNDYKTAFSLVWASGLFSFDINIPPNLCRVDFWANAGLLKIIGKKRKNTEKNGKERKKRKKIIGRKKR